MANSKTIVKEQDKPLIVHGIKIDVDPKIFEDFEVFDLLGEVDGGNVFAITKLIKLIFGDDWARVKKELQGKEDILTITKASEFLIEVMKVAGAKN